ncbi:MAG: hypothetical protein PHS41_03065 [Victivallaceae bacterium]|nr:hypothetical protein [Victivallaceae bacterium]
MAEQNADMFGRVGVIVGTTAKLESLLVASGGSGAGLHEKTESIRKRLPEDVEKKLHFIASVRNRAAHENPEFSTTEFAAFEEAVAFVKPILENLAVTAAASPEEAIAPEKPKRRKRSAAREQGIAVERELLTEFESFCRLTAFIPGLQVVFLARLFVYAITRSAPTLAAALLEISSITLMIEAIRSGKGFSAENPLLLAGGILFLSVYFAGVVMALRNRRVAALPMWTALTPGVNLVYFLYWSFIAIHWGSLFTGVLMVFGNYLGWRFLDAEKYRPMLIALGVSYLIGVIAGIFFSPSEKPPVPPTEEVPAEPKPSGNTTPTPGN